MEGRASRPSRPSKARQVFRSAGVPPAVRWASRPPHAISPNVLRLSDARNAFKRSFALFFDLPSLACKIWFPDLVCGAQPRVNCRASLGLDGRGRPSPHGLWHPLQPVNQRGHISCAKSVIDIHHAHIRRTGIHHPQKGRQAFECRAVAHTGRHGDHWHTNQSAYYAG